MASTHGRFVWYEYMAADGEAALAFYTRVVGWGTEKWDAGMDYTMLTNGAGPFAGLAPLAAEAGVAGMPPHWVAYIGTPDADGTVERAKALGASVIDGPIDVPSVGRMYFLQDPQGVRFAVHQSSSEGDMGASGAVAWHELWTTDQAAAFRFYGELFGWESTGTMDMGPMGTYQMYGHGQVALGGMMDVPAGGPMPTLWAYYFSVPDIHAAVERVAAAGGQVVRPVHAVPGGDLIAVGVDPWGAAFALHTRSA